ncbi:hypothetical protein Hanom_Chr12g01153191 [Helianthus anomalus]
MDVEVEDGGGFMYKDLLPFAGMVMVECMLIAAATLYKHATIQGINYYVFSFYVLLIGFKNKHPTHQDLYCWETIHDNEVILGIPFT